MELRAYWRVFLRRWWLAAAVTLAAAVVGFLTSPLTQGGYTASMRVLLSVPAEPRTGGYYGYDKYYPMLTAEFLTDDFIQVVGSSSFLQGVTRQMGGAPTTPVSIQAPPRRERGPRVINVMVSSADYQTTQRAAAAAVQVLESQAADYFSQIAPTTLAARVIDAPQVAAASAGGRNYLNIALRAALGLAAGLGLVLLLHYLDTTIYEPEDVARHLDIPVLGEIPRGR